MYYNKRTLIREYTLTKGPDKKEDVYPEIKKIQM